MAKFHLEIDELERSIILFALGSIYHLPGTVPLAQRFVGLANGEPAAPSKPVEGGSPTAAAPVSVPSQPARSFPLEKLDPDTELRTFKADSITKVGKRLIVKWQDRDTMLQASVWDEKLFPAVLGTVTREATYLVKRVKKGNAIYLNVMGVK